MLLKKLYSPKVGLIVGLSFLISACVTGTDSREDKMANGAAIVGLIGGVLAYNFVGAGSNQFIMTI